MILCKMCLRGILLICASTVLVLCISGCNGNNAPRESRFLSFNTSNDDITVSLDFTIPFLTIPVKKTIDSSFGLSSLGLPTININIASLMLGGIVVLGSAFLQNLPLLLKNYQPTLSHFRYAKLSDDTEWEAAAVLDILNKIIKNPNRIQGCIHRIACWTGQKTSPEFMKILTRIFSNDLVSAAINTTTYEKAIEFGRKRRNCYHYKPCPLKEEHFSIGIKEEFNKSSDQD